MELRHSCYGKSPAPTHTDDQLTEEAALALDVGPQHKEVVGDIYLAVLISIHPSLNALSIWLLLSLAVT